MEFEVGDIVMYEHTHDGNPRCNGSIGVVKAAIKEDLRVTWISGPDIERLKTRTTPHSWNLKKIGRVE